MNSGDDVNIDTSPELIPLQSGQQAPPLAPPFQAVPGQLRSIDGQLGPDLTFAVAAPLNNVQISVASAANTSTFGITGIGTMAQRDEVAAVADEATPDATDLATALTLVNALKDKVNELLGEMRNADHLTP